MATAPLAIQEGYDYQARWFWYQAIELFFDEPVATSVGYEVDDGAGFDDVVLHYDGPRIHTAYPEIRADFYQVKFHRALTGQFTAQALTEPGFIGRKRKSFLQGLRDAQRRHAPGGGEARFTIVSPWQVDSNDVLAKLYSRENDAIILPRLMEGGPTSDMGKTRTSWREHLELASDHELLPVLQTLRIINPGSLDQLRATLDRVLPSVGLKPFPPGKATNAYDTLPRRLHERGRHVFTRQELHAELAAEELLQPRLAAVASPTFRLGIRSFSRWAERMQDETDAMLDLAHCFAGRDPLDRALWADEIAPSVERFLQEQLTSRRHVELRLDAHQSVAFTAGWHLDLRSGVTVELVQRGVGGTTVWAPASAPRCDDPAVWHAEVVTLGDRPVTEVPDLAIVLNANRVARPEAEQYVRQHVPSAGLLLSLTPVGGISQQCVRDAGHAQRLAEDAGHVVSDHLSGRSRRARVHVFAAAPNALLFLLGRLARGWGRCQLYEYDFSRAHDDAYAPSITLDA